MLRWLRRLFGRPRWIRVTFVCLDAEGAIEKRKFSQGYVRADRVVAVHHYDVQRPVMGTLVVTEFRLLHVEEQPDDVYARIRNA